MRRIGKRDLPQRTCTDATPSTDSSDALLLTTLFLATLLLSALPITSALQVTEINAAPKAGTEWLELYSNTTLQVINWTIRDNLQEDALACCEVGDDGSVLPIHASSAESAPNETNGPEVCTINSFALVVQLGAEMTAADPPLPMTIPENASLLCVDDTKIGNGLGNAGDTIILLQNNGHLTNATYISAAEQGSTMQWNGTDYIEATPTPFALYEHGPPQVPDSDESGAADNGTDTADSTAAAPASSPQCPSLRITVGQDSLPPGEPVIFWALADPLPEDFSVTYWIEDLTGKIVKTKVTSSTNRTRQWTPPESAEEQAFIIRATIDIQNPASCPQQQASQLFAVQPGRPPGAEFDLTAGKVRLLLSESATVTAQGATNLDILQIKQKDGATEIRLEPKLLCSLNTTRLLLDRDGTISYLPFQQVTCPKPPRESKPTITLQAPSFLQGDGEFLLRASAEEPENITIISYLASRGKCVNCEPGYRITTIQAHNPTTFTVPISVPGLDLGEYTLRVMAIGAKGTLLDQEERVLIAPLPSSRPTIRRVSTKAKRPMDAIPVDIGIDPDSYPGILNLSIATHHWFWRGPAKASMHIDIPLTTKRAIAFIQLSNESAVLDTKTLVLQRDAAGVSLITGPLPELSIYENIIIEPLIQLHHHG